MTHRRTKAERLAEQKRLHGPWSCRPVRLPDEVVLMKGHAPASAGRPEKNECRCRGRTRPGRTVVISAGK